MSDVPTVKIKHLDRYLIINQSDYNENIHELYEDWVDKDSGEYIPTEQTSFQSKKELIAYAKEHYNVTLDSRKNFTSLLKILEGLQKVG